MYIMNTTNIISRQLTVARMLPFFLLPSCEEQIDELWDNDDDSQNVSPLVGDWYADSIKSFYSCVKTLDSTANVISDSYIENYNLWLLSDGSTQLYFDQSVNLQSECESYYGTWDSNSGCSDSYYEYYDLKKMSSEFLINQIKDAVGVETNVFYTGTTSKETVKALVKKNFIISKNLRDSNSPL